MNEWEVIGQISRAFQAVLGCKLTGIYLHGSMAFGCFCWACSDIDFLVVVEDELTQQEKKALIRVLLQMDEHAPPKGLEMSVVKRSVCSPFADPTPYEMHYSNAHRENYRRDLEGTCRMLQGCDPDLAAHMTVILHAGVAVCGEPVDEVFAPVPEECYLRSVWQDVRCAAAQIRQDPAYHVLNLCRTLAYVQEGKVLSKQQGGEWGMEHLHEHAPVILEALMAYKNGDSVPDGRALDRLAGEVLDRIRSSQVFLKAQIEKH